MSSFLSTGFAAGGRWGVGGAAGLPPPAAGPPLVVAKLDTELNDVAADLFSAADLQQLPCLKLFTPARPGGLSGGLLTHHPQRPSVFSSGSIAS